METTKTALPLMTLMDLQSTEITRVTVMQEPQPPRADDKPVVPWSFDSIWYYFVSSRWF